MEKSSIKETEKTKNNIEIKFKQKGNNQSNDGTNIFIYTKEQKEYKLSIFINDYTSYSRHLEDQGSSK